MTDISFEKITSRKNAKIISACALSDKKIRDEKGLFAAEGIKLLEELIYENVKIRELYCTSKALEKYYDKIIAANSCVCQIYEVTEEVYEKLSCEKNPEGIFAVAEKTKIYKKTQDIPGKCGFLILDGIQNPSNIGTVIRTASALGISRVLLGPGCADIFNHKTLRAAMGALFKVNICQASDLCSEITELRRSGVSVFAAALDKDSADIREVTFSPDDCIVLGNEGNGISPEVLALCDKKVIIPMQQNTESLNAASAAAILMWEKQKGVIS